MHATATALLQVDRLAEDLQIFNTTEFGFVELADAVTRGSVIMPQKKNPYSLAFIRGAAGSIYARLNEMYIIARTPSAQVDNRLFAHGAVPRALELAARSVYLMSRVCDDLAIDSDRMRQWVDAGFTQATDLAEWTAQEGKLDYKTAHQIVGRVVRELAHANKTAREVTTERLDAVALDILGHPLGLSSAGLATILDPVTLVASRTGIGGASPERVREMLDECRAESVAQRVWMEATARRVEAAEARLLVQARDFSRT
jgi:argininosuccinate lyase